jgi:hypothetical protein
MHNHLPEVLVTNPAFIISFGSIQQPDLTQEKQGLSFAATGNSNTSGQ